jgi:hypothetical protein
MTIPLIYFITLLIILWWARKLHLSGEWVEYTGKLTKRKCLILRRINILNGGSNE